MLIHTRVEKGISLYGVFFLYNTNASLSHLPICNSDPILRAPGYHKAKKKEAHKMLTH